MYFWRLNHQILFSKTLVGKTTVSDAKLFAIRLGVFKITNMNIKYIIIITDFLSSVRKTVDLSVYFKQAQSLAVYFVLKLFSCDSLGYKIKFWDFPSKAK